MYLFHVYSSDFINVIRGLFDYFNPEICFDTYKESQYPTCRSLKQNQFGGFLAMNDSALIGDINRLTFQSKVFNFRFVNFKALQFFSDLFYTASDEETESLNLTAATHFGKW